MNMNEKNKIKNCRIEPKLKLINMDSVEVEQVEWLLYPFIPYGKVTIIQGDPGEGKTTMVLQIIAKLTRGEPILPVTDTTKEKRSDEVGSENEDLDAKDNIQEQSSMSPVNVIYQTAEDGLGDTIKPRLLAAGADCSRVLVIDDSDQPLTMADARLEEAIVQTKAKMVVLDPIQGFLGADVDMHRANEIRPLMKRVAVLAEKYHCAVILIGHMNKNSNGKSSYRGLGSIDFQAAARSVLIVGRVKDEPEVRVVCHTKSSLAPEGTSIAFRLDKNNGFEWIGEYDISADELLNGDGRGQKSRKAKEFLLEILANGGMTQKKIAEEAEAKRLAKRQEVVNFALQFEGNPYVYGGTSLTNGADCSGFVMSVFANFGYSLPRVAAAQCEASTKKDISQLEPGDLVFYGSGYIDHVALYIGDGKIIHASNAATGIKISDYDYENPAAVGTFME